MQESRAIQFDLGRIDRLPASEIQRIRQVFVTHTHMDHFYGFDRLLRVFLSRDARLEVFGPPGILGNVSGKLAGYTWNLTESYPLVIDVHEVGLEKTRSARLAAKTGFHPEEHGTTEFSGRLVAETGFDVATTHLDHRIASMAFALREHDHLNIRTSELERRGWIAGRWLNDLKAAIRRGEPDTFELQASLERGSQGQTERAVLGELRDSLVVRTAGQKIAYVVDSIFSRANIERICQLVSGADVLFCESLFLDADRDEARKRYHLTARQAGTLARLAGVRQLRSFHFSPRYEGRAEELYAEAQAAFRGELEPDLPFF